MQITMNFLKLKNQLLSNTDIEWMKQHFQIKNIQKKKKKNRKLSKKDIFVTNETKKCVFCNNFIFFMKLRLNF